MTRAISVALCLGLLATTRVAAGFPRASGRQPAIQDSLRHLPPNMRFYELERRGLMPRSPASNLPESTGLRMVGKWGAGPSVKVTGRDSLVFLSRGSQVAVINYADTANPQVLSYIEVDGLVTRSVLAGNRLFVGSTGSVPKYIDVFDVSDPTAPQKLGQLQTRLLDIDVVDTLVYTVAKDSFRVFDFADPANPRQLGACRDTGYTLSMCNGYAYIADRWGLFVVDARDPTNPHHEASWGSDVISVEARGNICCATLGNPNQPDYLKLYVLDARNPSSIAPIGSLDSCGGYDLHLEDSLAFVSGYYAGGHEFAILSIADSTEPTRIGTCLTPGDGFGVWTLAPLHRSFVADRLAGLLVIDVSSLASPVADTALLTAGLSLDVAVQGDIACVANEAYGMVLLDVSESRRPTQIGALDSTTRIVTNAVAVRDSFAYMGYSPSLGDLHIVDISDPTRPVTAAGVNLFNSPEAIALSDSFVYCAESHRFEIVNAARPREPFLMGSCALPGTPGKLVLNDSTAYAPTYGVQCVSIAAPDSPVIVGTYGTEVVGLDIVDTVLYCAGPYAGLISLNVANPAAPRLLDSLSLTDTLWWNDVAVVNSSAYVGGERVWAVDISDPGNLRLVPDVSWTPPYLVYRLLYAAPYLYAACYEAGVCVLETTSVSVAEPVLSRAPWPVFTVAPSIVADHAAARFDGITGWVHVELYDAAGRSKRALLAKLDRDKETVYLPVAGLAPGVYMARAEWSTGRCTQKIVIRERRR